MALSSSTHELDEADELEEARAYTVTIPTTFTVDRDLRDRPCGRSDPKPGDISSPPRGYRDPRDSGINKPDHGSPARHHVENRMIGNNNDDDEDYEEVNIELEDRMSPATPQLTIGASRTVLGDYDPEDEAALHVEAPVALNRSLATLQDPLSPHKDPSIEAGDGSDADAKHCWGRLPRRWRTAIIMAFTFVVLLLLIMAILLPSNSGTTETKTRTFYIAADQVRWDYLPSSADLLYGQESPIPPTGQYYTEASETRIGSSYIKAQYRQYTDGTFESVVDESTESESKQRGILGPTIYCQVGDTISIVFKNNLEFTTSLHVHGLKYKKPSEGWYYGAEIRPEHIPDPPVQPGETREYKWKADENSGPESNDGLSIAWLYYPGQNVEADWNSGLIGMVVVTRVDGISSDGKPSQAAHNFPLLFATFDENLSPFLEQTAEENLGANWNPTLAADPDFIESNRMASINGFVFCNLPVLYMQSGSYVQWYLTTMSHGYPDEWYTAFYHGNPVVVDSHRIDAVGLTPGQVSVVEMRPANKGKWLLRAATANLFDRGVTALFEVEAAA